MKFSDWVSDDPAHIVDLRPEGAALELARYYRGAGDVVDEIIGQAYSLEAQTAVVEHRYLDGDYRSEHSRFYSTTFRRYPSVAHRLHFFRGALPPGWDVSAGAYDFSGLADSYLGYSVMRPLAGARVGRTMLQ